MRTRLFFISFLLLSFTVLEAQREKVLTPQDSSAKALKPIEGMAIVYVVRTSMLGFAIPIGVECDGEPIGKTHALKYVYTIQEPGKHTFLSKAENKHSLELDLEPGKIYYVQHVIKMGMLYARAKFKILPEKEGREALLKCRLSE